MEAVNKVINSASHAIWGDTDVQSQTAQQSHEEPISGVQGKGDANDPYDAGNRDGKPIFNSYPVQRTICSGISAKVPGLEGHGLNGCPHHERNELTSLGFPRTTRRPCL